MRVVLSSLLVAALAVSSQAATLEFEFNPFGTPTTGPDPVGILVKLTGLDVDEKITVQNTTFTAVNPGDLQNLQDGGIPSQCYSGTPGPAVQREKEAECADGIGTYEQAGDSWWGDYLTVHLEVDGITGGGTTDNSMGLHFGTGPFGDDEFDDPDSQGEPPFAPDPTNLVYIVIPDRMNEGVNGLSGVQATGELAISDGTHDDPDARIEAFDFLIACLIGDMDLDLDVDLDDVDPFVLALTESAVYETQFGVPSNYKGDIDGDGDNDLDDVDPFVCLLTTGDPFDPSCEEGGQGSGGSLAGGGGSAGASAVPEPSMFVLALLGFVGLVGSQTFSRSRR